MSVGDLTDVVTTINVPVVGSAEFSRGSFFMEWGISDMLSSLEATIFVKKTVGELLFDGYEDNVMAIGSQFSDLEEDETENMERFGWFYNVSTLLASSKLYSDLYNSKTQPCNHAVGMKRTNRWSDLGGQCTYFIGLCTIFYLPICQSNRYRDR